jgi:hypothetical protein
MMLPRNLMMRIKRRKAKLRIWQTRLTTRSRQEWYMPEGVILKPSKVDKPWFESRANGFPNRRIPTNDGRWTGKVGQSGWSSTKPKVIAITKKF